MDSPEANFQTPPPYWGPFPGESVELYEKLKVPAIYDAIEPYISPQLIGKFSMDYGMGVLAARHQEGPPPEDLTKQAKLEKFISWTKSNEKAHFVGIVVMGALTEPMLADRTTTDIIATSVWVTATAVLNIYPIMLQRYNRLKAYRTLEQLD